MIDQVSIEKCSVISTVHDNAKRLADDCGLSDDWKLIVSDLFNPNSLLASFDTFELDRKEWEQLIDFKKWMDSEEFKSMNKKERNKKVLEFTNGKRKLMKSRDDQTKELKGGNITKKDGTKEFVVNLAELAVPGKSAGIMLHRYCPETDADYIEEKRVVDVDGEQVEASHPHHRFDRYTNPCLRTSTDTSFKHATHYTAKQNGTPVDWDSINTDEHHERVVLADHDSIVLVKGNDEFLDVDGSRMSDEKQLKLQRIDYAKANGVVHDIRLSDGRTYLKQEQLCQFRSLSTLVFDMLVIAATSKRHKAVVTAVGTYSKTVFRQKGDNAFETSLMIYPGFKYHPESENRVRVTNSDRIDKSDSVMAKFLSLAVFDKDVLYRYGRNKLEGKYSSPEEMAAINALCGITGKGYAVIAKRIDEHRESGDNDELMTKLEILNEIKPTLKEVTQGAINGYEKLLVLWEQVDAIKAIIEGMDLKNREIATKRECFESIRNGLPETITEKGKNMYCSFLALEQQRQGVINVYATLDIAKAGAAIVLAQAENEGVVVDILIKELQRMHPELQKGVFEFVKQGLDVKTVHEEAKKLLLHNPSANRDAILSQIKIAHPSINPGAIAFFKGGEVQRNGVQTVHEEAAQIQQNDPSATTSTILAQIKSNNPKIKPGAIAFFEGGEVGKMKFNQEKERLNKGTNCIASFVANAELSSEFSSKLDIYNEIKDTFPNWITEDIKARYLKLINKSSDTKLQQVLTALFTKAGKLCDNDDSVSINSLAFIDFACKDCLNGPIFSVNDYITDVRLERGEGELVLGRATCRCCGVRHQHRSKFKYIRVRTYDEVKRQLDQVNAKNNAAKKTAKKTAKKIAKKTASAAKKDVPAPTKKRAVTATKATKKPIYETNPVATAALQAALDSAQDGDGVVDPKCLKKALAQGYSKVYIDAKVDERIELNVKPAAKKLKTEL